MSEEDFHKQRRMFVVSHDPSKMAPLMTLWSTLGDARSHSQWFTDRGWDWAHECVRGFADDSGVYFYRGPEFDCDELTIRTAVAAVPELKRLTEVPCA